MTKIKLELDVEAVQGIINTLGQLPTSSGAFPLLCDIKAQADAQIAAASAEASGAADVPNRQQRRAASRGAPKPRTEKGA
ncbi:hypothetical protein [Sphingomonas sp. SRS2]|uniref:hypothetical protein n=1 Tax=Sphingomonas sp. SRS2 TaxID=133190 RepID=UPI0006184F3A|nr:hypothetical protein [Sphingomonas sp. SRS2]KKC24846.1 hypothetical protein WP12_16535 [Sphingomonas sp. SRS2]